MARVLLVGYEPETVDFSNPALPPGMSVEKIRAGIVKAQTVRLNPLRVHCSVMEARFGTLLCYGPGN